MIADCGLRIAHVKRLLRLIRIPQSAIILLLAGACSSHPALNSPGAARVPRIEFVPESETFAAAVGEYERIWAADAARIARTMQDVSGLTFTDTAVTAVVFEGARNSSLARVAFSASVRAARSLSSSTSRSRSSVMRSVTSWLVPTYDSSLPRALRRGMPTDSTQRHAPSARLTLARAWKGSRLAKAVAKVAA